MTSGCRRDRSRFARGPSAGGLVLVTLLRLLRSHDRIQQERSKVEDKQRRESSGEPR